VVQLGAIYACTIYMCCSIITGYQVTASLFYWLAQIGRDVGVMTGCLFSGYYIE